MTTIQETATALLSRGKGLLVLDRYAHDAISRSGAAESTTEGYVELALVESELSSYISGVVLTPDVDAPVVGQSVLRGVSLDPTEVVADLSGSRATSALRARVTDLTERGISFVEWRANMSTDKIARGETHVNASALARAAAISQSLDVLPVVTAAVPEIELRGIYVTQAATSNALLELFRQFEIFGVDPARVILRVNMIVPSADQPFLAEASDVARATLRVIGESTPENLAGIAFLSGGQQLDRACANLSAICDLARRRNVPRTFTFGFTRALVTESLRLAGSQQEMQSDLVSACRRASQSLLSPATESASR